MSISEFKSSLSKHPDLTLRFQLSNGKFIPAHAHVTEVARVDKRFIDCGGKFHSEAVCRLQLWVAKDFWHRFKAGKLLAILDKAQSLLGSDDLDVDIEYESRGVTQSPVAGIEVVADELVVKLAERHTACLAKDEHGSGRARFFKWWNSFRRRTPKPREATVDAK